MHLFPPPSLTVVNSVEDGAWRGRTLAACALAAVGVVAVSAAHLDWSEGVAMALGQLAGMVAPLAVLGLVVWGAAALVGRKA